MAKRVAGAVIAAALVLAGAGAWPAAAHAQNRLDVLQLVAPGSTIGVSIDDVSADEATKARLNQPEGVIVRSVQDGSPASRAGLRAGDVVVEFDGDRVRSSRQFQRLVQETPPNRTVKATIVRDGSRQTLDITPEAGRAGTSITQDGKTPFFANPRIQPLPRGQATPFQVLPQSPFTVAPQEGRLGAAIIPVGSQLATYFGVKGGALVESVNANSPAQAAGLRAGDVITAVGGRETSTPQQVIDAVRAAPAGSALELTVVRDKKTIPLKATLPGAEKPAQNNGDRIRL